MINQEEWQKCKKILCVRLDNIGDVLMTTPAFRAIKKTIKGSGITLLTSEIGKKAASLVPEIDEIITFKAPWMKSTSEKINSQYIYETANKLKKYKFDGAIIFNVYSQNPLPSALLCFLADIPKRLGYCHENPYQLLTDWIPDPEPARFIKHEVKRQLDLIAAIGCQTSDDNLSIRISQNTDSRVFKILKNHGVDLDKPRIILHPGASDPERIFSREEYVKAGEKIAFEFDCQIIVTGSAEEFHLVQEVSKNIGKSAFPFSGEFSLEEFTALISSAPLIITNNTGAVHVASAVDTPVIVLYASTNPQHTPWKVKNKVLNYDVPCKACQRKVCAENHQGFFKQVKANEIIQAAEELLFDKFKTLKRNYTIYEKDQHTHSNMQPT